MDDAMDKTRYKPSYKITSEKISSSDSPNLKKKIVELQAKFDWNWLRYNEMKHWL